jgi:hypothetical protein
VEAEFGKQGLRVVALSNEPLAKVEPYVDQMDLPFLVAAGSTSGGVYGVSGIPHSFLIDAEGNLAWEGNPGDLSKGVIKKALKGAKRPKVDFLSVRIDGEVDGRLAKARELAADGELSEAMKEIESTLSDEKSDEGQKKAATALQGAIDAHAKLLASQVEKLLKSRDVERAIAVLEGLSKALPASEAGANARKRLDEIGSDVKLKGELEAAKALQRLKDQIRPLKKDKARPKIEEFVKKYAGTRAAERAANLTKTVGSKD